MGVPYVPIVGLAGSHLLERREDMLLVPDPFDPAVLTVVARALRPDVALFHALEADRAGNVSTGYPSDNVLLAEASRTVIVTAERIVERVAPQDAVGTFMPGLLVDAVVEAPGGAHPAACPGAYAADAEHMAEYVAASRGDEAFAAYLEKYVFSVPDHAAYLERHAPGLPPGGHGAGGGRRAAGD
jgi:glutaconate CoA-transferase subunit A